jgi:hypothetical protein
MRSSSAITAIKYSRADILYSFAARTGLALLVQPGAPHFGACLK